MEQVLSRLRIPFTIILVIALAYLALQAVQAYEHYWSGKLAQAQYNEIKNGKA